MADRVRDTTQYCCQCNRMLTADEVICSPPGQAHLCRLGISRRMNGEAREDLLPARYLIEDRRRRRPRKGRVSAG